MAKLANFAVIMKLFADIGNSFMKAAVNDGNALREVYYGPAEIKPFRDALKGFTIDGGMWCTVSEIDAGLSSFLSSMNMVQLTHETPVPLKNLYSTPQTLGMDRLAAAVGAWSLKQGHDLLVIDMGTAVTFDLVTAAGEYAGGNIAPGAALRFSSLYEHTGRLPLVDADGPTPRFGLSTADSIRSGVIRGINNEINGYIVDLKEYYPSLFVFLTGGDIKFFDMNCKSGIFAVANLVLKGLACIFDYNEKS